MNELIKVTVNEEQKQLVSARELHEYLEVGTHFKDWFPRMCEYGFVEMQDFNPLNFEQVQCEGTRSVMRTLTDYAMSIDMAKEICMLQRTEKGKQARQYFIELEKAWNNPEMVFARSLQFANQKMIEYKNKLELMQPMVEAYEDLLSTKNNHNMNEVAKLVGLGRNRLFEKLRQNKVLMNSNLPYESYIDRGYFTVREVVIHKANYDDVKRQTLVTTKGVDWINKKLKEWQ
jgi:anti-repressor protein